jgi:hypothetical protein
MNQALYAHMNNKRKKKKRMYVLGLGVQDASVLPATLVFEKSVEVYCLP